MPTETKRARRIRDKQRMKAKAKRVAGFRRWYSDPARVIKHADYMAVCSCDMCGNPRRRFGSLTLAEKRARLKDE